jgi:hypothetical protein
MNRRGQSLVLFALCLLLLTLMVLVTLSIGMRAKEKTEAQMLADAAAYSQAVAVARTFNVFALLNRQQVSHEVVLAGTEALISWSGAVYAAVNEACPGKLTALEWNLRDEAAGAQVFAQADAAYYLSKCQTTLHEKLVRVLEGQTLAERIVSQASSDGLGRIERPNAVAELQTVGAFNRDEVGVHTTEPARGVLAYVHDDERAQVFQSIGTLGFKWVRGEGREAGVGWGVHSDRPPLSWPEAEGDLTMTGIIGMHEATYETVNGASVWAHTHGSDTPVTVQCGDEARTVTLRDAWVLTTHLQNRSDQHVYGDRGDGRSNEGAVDDGVESGEVYMRHTVAPCLPQDCPTVWHGLRMLNSTVLDESTDFQQPTLISMITRDYANEDARYPWNLFFNYRWAEDQYTFDNGDPARLGELHDRGKVLRRQAAFSSAAVYYHRPAGQGAGFQEAPNLFNPFWRATLVSSERAFKVTGAEVERTRTQLSNAGLTEHAETLRLLEQAHFKGGVPE